MLLGSFSHASPHSQYSVKSADEEQIPENENVVIKEKFNKPLHTLVFSATLGLTQEARKNLNVIHRSKAPGSAPVSEMFGKATSFVHQLITRQTRRRDSIPT